MLNENASPKNPLRGTLLVPGSACCAAFPHRDRSSLEQRVKSEKHTSRGLLTPTSGKDLCVSCIYILYIVYIYSIQYVQKNNV